MYEFGYGLSYTSFSISDIKLSAAKFDGVITAAVNVKNTGAVADKQVVQLYIDAPETTINKPKQELKGFIKTGLLQPGQSHR